MKWIFLILFTFCSTTGSFAQKDWYLYPSYEEMVEQFLTQYDWRELSTMSDDLQFQKRREGWFLARGTYSEDGTYHYTTDLFWDKKSKHYLWLEIPRNKEHNVENALLMSITGGPDVCRNSIDCMPYWNYPDSYLDIIQDYRTVEDLPDSILYGVGRAWSTLSNVKVIHDPSVSSDKGLALTIGGPKMTPDEVALFLEGSHKAIELWKLIENRNPDFQTLVGNISLKIANEYMDNFIYLRMYAHEEFVQSELKQCKYDAFTCAYARAFLGSCAENAILFTNSDMDTYPLLYVQENEGYRKDVLVVNLSLLNLSHYIDYLRLGWNGAFPLPISMDKAKYNDGKLDVAMILPNETLENISLSDAISQITDEKHKVPTVIESITVPFLDNYKMQLDNINLRLSNAGVCPKMENSDSNTMRWELTDEYGSPRNYLTIGEIVFLDILKNCMGNHPLYFTCTTGGKAYLGLSKYLQMEGMAYRIVPCEYPADMPNVPGGICEEIMLTNIRSSFDLSIQESSWNILRKDSNRDGIANNFLFSYSALAGVLIDEKKQDDAKFVLNKCLREFPENHYSDLSPRMLSVIAQQLYYVGENEKGMELTRKLFLNTKEEFEFFINSPEWQRDVHTNELDILVLIQNQLLPHAQEALPDSKEIGDMMTELTKWKKELGIGDE